MNLRSQLSLAVTAVTGVVLCASFATVVVLVKRDEMRDLDRALAAQAHATAELVVARGTQHPELVDRPAELPENLDPSARFVAVYGKIGRLVSQSESFHGQAPTADAFGLPRAVSDSGRPVDLRLDDSELRGVLVPLANGRTLLYAASRRSVDDDIAYLMRVLLGLFAAAMLATSLVARWVAGLLVRDVGAIAQVVRKVATGELEARAGSLGPRSADARALAADLDHMIERLSALVAAQRTFVSHAAHELRSPLATIRGELQLALRRQRSTEEYRQAIEEALIDVEALSQLAEDLLTLARAESASGVKETTAVGRAVAEALRMARGSASARNVELVRAEAEGTAELRVGGAAGEIARVLRNLIDNAVAHSEEGGEVLVGVSRAGERVRLTVTDSGAGVSLADRPHIFSPFFRSSKDRGDRSEEVGAGLGLSIAREIARRHGGDVWFDADYSGGARFVAELPTVEATGYRPQPASEPTRPSFEPSSEKLKPEA